MAKTRFGPEQAATKLRPTDDHCLLLSTSVDSNPRDRRKEAQLWGQNGRTTPQVFFSYQLNS